MTKIIIVRFASHVPAAARHSGSESGSLSLSLAPAAADLSRFRLAPSQGSAVIPCCRTWLPVGGAGPGPHSDSSRLQSRAEINVSESYRIDSAIAPDRRSAAAERVESSSALPVGPQSIAHWQLSQTQAPWDSVRSGRVASASAARRRRRTAALPRKVCLRRLVGPDFRGPGGTWH